jgi:1A family penicillin-binding protein
VRKATIAIEDSGFYNHSAIDIKGMFRALFVNIIRGGISQGASTITQQLAKNAFLTPERTFSRKINEIILAFWIERYYTKDQILNLYLNQISYGAGANGIEAAAQTYFGKSAKDLTILESATLAGMAQIPSYYSPWGTHKAEMLKRKDLVLENMYSDGYITKQQRDSNLKISPHFLEQNIGSIKAPHFSMTVRDYLINKYGEDVVNKGGLKVITTLDYDLQQSAEKAVSEGAANNTELYKGKNASLVAEDPKTGQILALVGSANYFDTANDGNFNVATQGLRQPGSSIKPFAYMTAFQKGYTPDTLLFDLSTEFDTSGTATYRPENYDHTYRGPISLRDSLAQSINVTAVKTLYLAGINDTVKNAYDFGLTTLTDPKRYGLSFVLGGGEVRLIDMVEGYSVFAQDGVKHQQSFVLSVEDDHNSILEKYLDRSSQIIDPQYPRLINDILSDGEARRPLFENSFNLTVFPDRQVALKTGTTNDYRDAWVMGYTPSLVVGVWAGNNDSTPMQRSGGSILAAVPIWNAFMTEALTKFPTETFTKPEAVSVSKPMFDGQYNINGEIHSILHYVDRSNPTGPAPENPTQDPQYNLWEGPVRIWASQNK